VALCVLDQDDKRVCCKSDGAAACSRLRAAAARVPARPPCWLPSALRRQPLLAGSQSAAAAAPHLPAFPGLRFSGGADTTVKLCTNMVYKLQLTSTPAITFV
jgi:hypothetical protein